MFRRLSCVKIILPMLWAVSSNAQTMLPNAADLKSAYCIDRNQRVLSAHLQLLELLKDESLPGAKELREQTTKSKARDEQQLQRMRAYLLPRMPYLDSTALLAAIQRSREDSKVLSDCKCTEGRSADFASCFNSCTASSGGAAQRLQSCDDVTWLPF